MTRLALALGVGLLVGLLCGLLPVRSALADPAKVLVLPLDGDADPGVRAKYSAAVQRMARSLGGKVTPGDVTFTDTATAIGCDPESAPVRRGRPRDARRRRADLRDGVPAERQARPERAPRGQGQAPARRDGDARGHGSDGARRAGARGAVPARARRGPGRRGRADPR